MVGTKIQNKHAGNFGMSGSFHFIPQNKLLQEKEEIITNNKKFYDKVKKLKVFGIDKDIKDRKTLVIMM